MSSWEQLRFKQKIEIILSVYDRSGEKLRAQEMVDRIRKLGIEPPTPQKLGMFIRRYLEYKYLERVRERDNHGHPITYWRLT